MALVTAIAVAATPKPIGPPRRNADAAGTVLEETGLGELLEWADVVVVVTAHAAIDWSTVYDRAALVVDTVDSSRGRQARDRQVLRLGAGWSTRA